MKMGPRSALAALWLAIRGQRHPGAPSTGQLLAALPRMVLATLRGRYPGLDRHRLGLMLLAALYVVSPIDLVPEAALLVVGLVDDAVVLAWLAGAVLAETEQFLAWEAGVTGADGAGRAERVVPGQVI